MPACHSQKEAAFLAEEGGLGGEEENGVFVRRLLCGKEEEVALVHFSTFIEGGKGKARIFFFCL